MNQTYHTISFPSSFHYISIFFSRMSMQNFTFGQEKKTIQMRSKLEEENKLVQLSSFETCSVGHTSHRKPVQCSSIFSILFFSIKCLFFLHHYLSIWLIERSTEKKREHERVITLQFFLKKKKKSLVHLERIQPPKVKEEISGALCYK